VPPHLVQSAGLWLRLDERTSIHRRAGNETKSRDGRHARSAFALWNRVVDHALRRWTSAHEREIALFDQAAIERAREMRRSRLRSCEHEGAARSAIEPVHRIHVTPDRVAHAKHRDVVVVIPPAVDEQARRFVGHDDVRVDVEEANRPVQTRAA